MSPLTRCVLQMTLLALCTCALASAGALQADPKEALFQASGSAFGAISCERDEEPVSGKLPECEPSCRNPLGICPKMLLLDAAFCFCKRGLLREHTSNRCVPAHECPAPEALGGARAPASEQVSE